VHVGAHIGQFRGSKPATFEALLNGFESFSRTFEEFSRVFQPFSAVFHSVIFGFVRARTHTHTLKASRRAGSVSDGH
jgi:hypothetical protein